MIHMEEIILASSSPRRSEILRDMGLFFSIMPPDIDENIHEELEPSERVLAIAYDKAVAVAARCAASNSRWILAADTLVCTRRDDCPDPRPGKTNNESSVSHFENILGKPTGREDANRMIRLLAGTDHFVHTGIALLDRITGTCESARSDSTVYFASMTEKEIEEYLDSDDWNDVAGAYRVQGLAARYIQRIEGSWSGIVGLPIHDLYVILRKVGLLQ